MNAVGAIEAGGTKFVCGIATVDGRVLARTEFPTTNPRDNYSQAIEFIQAATRTTGPLGGIGIGHFGPLNVDPSSPDYGRIGSTPKPGWAGADIRAEVARLTKLPVAIDTDVNCAAVAEARWGAGKGLDDLVYVTVGTGIGAGILSDGRLVYGRAHPEVGHLFLPQAEEDRDFEGSCPFHGARCAEGLASGPAILKRWGKAGAELDDDHPAWPLEASYLAILCIDLALFASPSRLILGGGVMQQPQLLPMIRQRFTALMNDYADTGQWAGSVEELIVGPGLGGDAGLLGAAAIAPGFDA